MDQPLLSIQHIDVHYGQKIILQDVSMRLDRKQIVGIVGESGSGKSTTIYSVLGVLGKTGRVTDGEIWYNNTNLLKLKQSELRKICGKHLSLVAQNPMESFHPIRKLEKEIRELAKAHKGVSPKEAEESMVTFMERMKLDGRAVLKKYAYELSGGMCQRASIAMAMSLHPEVLFADEPTSALDVTVQKQVVEELMRIRDDRGTAIMIVSHNMGIISYMADYIYVMLAGMVVECGSREQVIRKPMHPYTQNLISVIPRINTPAQRDVKATESVRGEQRCPYCEVCSKRKPECAESVPTLRQVDENQFVRCHFVS